MRSSSSRRTFLQTLSLAVPLAAARPPRNRRRRRIDDDVNVARRSSLSSCRKWWSSLMATKLRVKELVGRQPALAKATWDWGFGDWETSLGAASHVGHRGDTRSCWLRTARTQRFSQPLCWDSSNVVKGFVAALARYSADQRATQAFPSLSCARRRSPGRKGHSTRRRSAAATARRKWSLSVKRRSRS